MKQTSLLRLGALTLAASFVAGQVSAQTNDPSNNSYASTNQPPPPPAYHPFTISPEIGLASGYGGELSWRFWDYLGVRGGMDYFRYTGSHTYDNVQYSGKIKLMSEPFALDVYPFPTRSLRISLGMVWNQNRIYGNTANGSFTLNGTTYPGDLTLRVKQHPLDPYAAIGGNFFYFDTAHHWSLGGELGAYYAGNAHVNLYSSNPFANNDVQTEKSTITRDADRFKFMPVAKLQVNFSF